MSDNPRQELKELAAANAWTIGIVLSSMILAAAMAIEAKNDQKLYAKYRQAVSDTEAKIRAGYTIKCPDCGLDIIAGSRLRVGRAYIAHLVNTCPGDPAYVNDPNLKA